MSKGIPALEYLPQINLVLPTGNAAASTEAFRGLIGLLSNFLSAETVDGTYNGAIALGNTPYASSEWNIAISDTGATYSCFFVSEIKNEDLGAKGRAALTTRRAVDILKLTDANKVSLRSFQALINFIESIEDEVAESGNGAAGDATYTAIPLRGNTPFKTYEWTVVKLADLYTVTATANSN